MFWFDIHKKDLPYSKPKKEFMDTDAQKKQEQAFRENLSAGQDLNRLLVENGFTIKIYLATGGKTNKDKNHD